MMGGEVSEVSDSTTRVAMEAATWVGSNIMRTQAKLPATHWRWPALASRSSSTPSWRSRPSGWRRG